MAQVIIPAEQAAHKGVSLSPAARRKRFLATLAETANITRSAKEAGMERSAVYRLRARSESFRAAWDEAMNQALDDLEALLIDRAANGIEKPVFYGGKPCGTTRHYSDALAIFLLRARRPEIYARSAAATDYAEPDEDDADKAREDVHARLNRIADSLQVQAVADGSAECHQQS